MTPVQWLKTGIYSARFSFSEPITHINSLQLERNDSGDIIPLESLLITSADLTATLKIENQNQGTYNLLLIGYFDQAGNSQTSQLTTSVIIDTLPPRQPTLVDFRPWVNDTRISITLDAEADTTTQLYIDGHVEATHLSPQTRYALTLNEGMHRINSSKM